MISIQGRSMILCCGEALIDFVPQAGEKGYRPLPGGSIFNCAVAIGRLGVPVGLFSRLSTDFFGDMLLEALAENGIDTHLIVRAPDPTTLAFVSLPGDGTSEPRYQFYANGSADCGLTAADLPQHLPEAVSALHFGSISLVLEPGASTLEDLMRRESHRRIISLDPNIRPSLIPDHNSYLKRFESWLEQIDILRLSISDLEWLYPGAEPEPLINDWLQQGPCLCLLTRGELGASVYHRNGPSIHLPAPPVRVVDTVGAGDSFMGACLAGFFRLGRLASRSSLDEISARELEACLSFGVRAAAINCSRPGADPPRTSELD